MTPLEAAKAMPAVCFCPPGDHKPDCPVGMLPKIVRALEDAESARYHCSGCAASVTEPLKKVQS